MTPGRSRQEAADVATAEWDNMTLDARWDEAHKYGYDGAPDCPSPDWDLIEEEWIDKRTEELMEDSGDFHDTTEEREG